MNRSPTLPEANDTRLCTGIPGFDEILGGGFPARRLYLIQGDPGAGKTTLALRFLLEGVKRGERSLYVTLSETRDELADIAGSHGWSLEGLSIAEVSSDVGAEESETTLFQPAEVELGQRMRALLAEVDRLKPTRIALDSCSELRLLAQSPLRYRRQILALKQRLAQLGSTILLLDNPHPDSPDMLLQSVAHGVVIMEQLAPLYGAERRRLRVLKLRGLKYRGGYHDFVIRTGGLDVFPRLVASEHRREFTRNPISSGIPELDALLGGGPECGMSLLLMGPSGCGKSAVAAQFALAAATRGEGAAVFGFDESAAMYLARAESLGCGCAPTSTQAESHSSRSIPRSCRRRVRSRGAARRRGRRGPTRGDRQLERLLERHATGELPGAPAARASPTSRSVASPGDDRCPARARRRRADIAIDLSYLADAVLLFRYFEATGQVRKAVSAVKDAAGSTRTPSASSCSGRAACASAFLWPSSRSLAGTPQIIDPPRKVGAAAAQIEE